MSCIPHAGETFSGRRKTIKEDIFNLEAEIIQERKWLDTPASRVGITMLMNRAQMDITLLNGIAQGTDQNQRVGKRVRIRNIGIRGTVEGNQDSTGVCDPGLCLILLIYDRQSVTGTPTAADILQYGVGDGPAPGTSHPSSTFLNMANAERFVVLRRWMKVLGPWEKDNGQLGYCDKGAMEIDWNLDVDLEVIWSGAGTGVNQIKKGALYLCCTGDVAVRSISIPLNNDYKFVFHARIRYVDS